MTSRSARKGTHLFYTYASKGFNRATWSILGILAITASTSDIPSYKCDCEESSSSDTKYKQSKGKVESQKELKLESGSDIQSRAWSLWSLFNELRRTDSLFELQKTLPRPLISNDNAFDWPELRKGLRKRADDERRLINLQEEAKKLFIRVNRNGDDQSQHRIKMLELADKIAQIAYGKGITAEMRQNYLIKYGCTAWTDQVMTKLLEIGKHRGFVECGAGNGQWAKNLNNRRIHLEPQFGDAEFVLAFDDYSSLPLNPKVYMHQSSLKESVFNSFYHNVRFGNATNIFTTSKFEESTDKPSTYGRILLIIYPSPGDMASKSLSAYVDQGSKNDYFVYIGEGRGGANADDSFFDLLEDENCNHQWILENVYPLNPIGNGFERAFFFRRVPKI